MTEKTRSALPAFNRLAVPEGKGKESSNGTSWGIETKEGESGV